MGSIITTALNLLTSLYEGATTKLVQFLIILAAFVAIFWYVFHLGQVNIQDKWDLSKAQTEKQIAELTAKANETTTVTVIKYVTRTQTITEHGAEIIKFIDRYITPEENAACVIPKNFILLHDASVSNIPPDASKFEQSVKDATK
jgi:hypothetical protein